MLRGEAIFHFQFLIVIVILLFNFLQYDTLYDTRGIQKHFYKWTKYSHFTIPVTVSDFCTNIMFQFPLIISPF